MIDRERNGRRGESHAEWNWYSAERGDVSSVQRATLARSIGTRLQQLYPVTPGEAPTPIHDILAKLAAKDV